MPTVRLMDPSALHQSAKFDTAAGLDRSMMARVVAHAAWFSKFDEHSDWEMFVVGENRAAAGDRGELLV